jgi:hypothetical protein
VEVNASDTRNKSDAKVKAGIGGKLSNAVRELATNSTIGAGTDGRPKRVSKVLSTHVSFCPAQALSPICADAGAQHEANDSWSASCCSYPSDSGCTMLSHDGTAPQSCCRWCSSWTRWTA